MVNINLLDLFSGIGGFHLGILKAGINIDSCFHSEIDKSANAIYQNHFINSIGLGDVKTIKSHNRTINGKYINLITFGFPCQDLSLAGKRKGFNGNRSSLFFEAIRIIEELQPQYFIFENVKGFFSSNGGKDFAIALKAIADIGYDGQWQLVNTAWFLPQNRERVYFVGYPRGKCAKQIFPLRTENLESHARCSQIQQDFRCLTARGYLSGRGNFLKQINQSKTQGYRVYDSSWSSCTLSGESGGMGAKTGLYSVGDDIRILTPIECERLQGFPDDWTALLSNNQRYKCLGNAVSVPVVQHVIQNIYYD